MGNDVDLIELKNITRFYEKDGKNTVGVKDVSFKVKKGEIVAILGPSGCGKTTILRMIANLILPSSGFIYYRDKNINYARVNGLISYIPQTASLIPFRTILENIRLPLELKKITDLQKVSELVSLCSLSGFENYFPSELSVGMKQRTAIARALTINPEVILMDEPFASLDEIIKEKLNEEVLRIQATLRTTILYVTHNIEEAVFLANKIIILSCEPGTVVDIIDIDLPLKRDSILRTEEIFFRETIKVRKSLKKYAKIS